VARDVHVDDVADVPPLALREMISNALLHRSLTSVQESVSIAIEVGAEAVVVTSPGGLHAGADTATLGLDSISGVRNLTLVRICEQLRTPEGHRIIENHASGIAKADEDCRALGTMPPLFIDQPARFQVVLFRGAIPLDTAAALLEARGAATSDKHLRLVAVVERLRQAKDETPISGLDRIAFDARLAARVLAATTVEDATAQLLELEASGVLERRHTRHGASWALRPEPAAPGGRDTAAQPTTTPRRRRRRDQPDRVIDVLRAIAGSESGELLSSEIGGEMGLRSPTSVGRWIGRAGDSGLVEPTNESHNASNRRYRLTRGGVARLERDQPNGP
jgi:ATP-dependent DNA helicase RecG